MAGTIGYPINKKLSKYAHIQLIFGTDAGTVETNDEWMTKSFFAEINKLFPEGVGADNDRPGWYDKPSLHLILHGWDDLQKSQDPDIGDMTLVTVYFDLKNGIIKKVETEGLG